MKSQDRSTIALSNQAVDTAKALQTLYFVRVAFSVIWVLLVLTLSSSNAYITMTLFAMYPA